MALTTSPRRAWLRFGQVLALPPPTLHLPPWGKVKKTTTLLGTEDSKRWGNLHLNWNVEIARALKIVVAHDGK